MKQLCAMILSVSLCASQTAAQGFTTLKGHGGPIMGLDVSIAGQVATASFDNSVGLWLDRKPTWLEGHEAAVNVVQFMTDGRILSGGDDFALRLWDHGETRVLGRHRGKVTSLAVSGDGALVASGSWDGSVGLWPLDGGAPRFLTLRDSGVNDLVFTADGRGLLVAGTKGEILQYDIKGDAAPRPLVKHGFGVNKLVLGPAGTWLAYGAVDGGTRVVDARTGTAIADFTLDRKPILALEHHAPTGLLAVGDGQGYIMLVNSATWRIQQDFRATRKGPVWALAFSPDGAMIYAGGLDDVAYGWPIALMDGFDPAMGQERSFLKDADKMPNGERQFMRKCSICHALEAGASRKAGPSLHNVFGRPAGTVPDYAYSPRLAGSAIIWSEATIDQLFDQGPDHFIPGSKMPMQVIAAPQDRRDLIQFLKTHSQPEETKP
ncbi:MAG: cytochrome c [Sulfitobacter sp.]|jgi:cytochrome c